MANINLISVRRQERLRLNKIARYILMGMVGVAAIGLGTISYFGTMIGLANAETGRQQKRLNEIKPELDEIRAAETERIKLQPKLVTLSEAQSFTGRWHGILEGMKRATPEQTWLTNFAVEGNPEGYKIRLNGVTSNQTRVGETMLRLTAQPEYYQKVNLGYTQATQIENIPTVEFELTAELTPVGNAVAKAAEAGAAGATTSK